MPDGPARRNRCVCPSCHAGNSYPTASAGAPSHRLFAIEYHCESCKRGHKGRFFKAPEKSDLRKLDEIDSKWRRMRARFVPDDKIPEGDETNRLHRWGYRRW